ncbi:hypothetical protein LXL04_009942 [Taraxacum kok-saghyz]
MEGVTFQEKKLRVLLKCSSLLELAAADDVSGFVSNVEGKRIDLDEVGFCCGELKGTNLDDVFGSFELQSPTGHQQIRQNVDQLWGNYKCSPIRKPTGFAFDSSAAVAQAWGSPEGKLEWGFSGEDANKFRKSASFGFRNGVPVNEPDVSWVNTIDR